MHASNDNVHESVGHHGVRRRSIDVEFANKHSQEVTRSTSWQTSTEMYRDTAPRSWSNLFGVASWVNHLLESLLGLRIQRVKSKKSVHSHPYENEEHHLFYGGPWCRGRDHFDSLLKEGLKQDDYVLDLGCGSLRVGVWLIHFLNDGRYCGIDSHFHSLDCGARYEVPLHGLAGKQPRLLHSDQFEVGHFGVAFDVVVATAVFCHLNRDQQHVALKNIVESSSPRLRLFVYQSGIEHDLAAEHGLKLEKTVEHSEECFNKGSTIWKIYSRST